MNILMETKERNRLPGTFLVHYAEENSVPNRRWN